MAKLAELVQTESKDLPASSQTLTDIRKQRRKRRMRSVSDGVAFMRKVAEQPTAGVSGAAANILAEDGNDKASLPVPVEQMNSDAVSGSGFGSGGRGMRRQRIRRKKTMSANVALMRSPSSSLFAPPTESSPANLSEENQESPDKPKRRPSLDAALSTGRTPLPQVMEGIPAMGMSASGLTIPLGRKSAYEGVGPSKPTHLAEAARPRASRTKPSALGAIVEGKERTRSLVVLDLASPKREDTDGAAEDKDNEKKEDEEDVNGGDDNTIISVESDGDHSDFDDVPEIAASVRSLKVVDQEPVYVKAVFDIKAFLQTSRYRLLSGVFGTMILFFNIGMRVEIFLIESGTIPDTKSTWQ
jgi:hypothetical protein